MSMSLTIDFLCPYRALLFVSHGVGEHMKRYDELSQFLIKHGILVFGHDQGKSCVK